MLTSSKKIAQIIGLVLFVMVGVTIYTVAMIDTPNPHRWIEPSPSYTPFTRVPLPVKDRPEYSPPSGQGSSRAREK